MNWRLTVSDARGNAVAPPREHIRGFFQGDARTIRRQVVVQAGAPAIQYARLTLKTRVQSDVIVVQKVITNGITDAGQITVENGLTYFTFKLTSAETILFTSRLVFDADCHCADGQFYTVGSGTVAAARPVSPLTSTQLHGEPVAVTLTAPVNDMLLGETHRFTAAAVDGFGIAVPAPAFVFTSSDPLRLAVDAATGDATVLMAGGDANPVTVTVSLAGILSTVTDARIVKTWLRPQIIIDGNSISDHTSAGGASLRRPAMYWTDKLALLYPEFDFIVKATSGLTTLQLSARAPGLIDPLLNPLCFRQILLMWEFVNDQNLTIPLPTAQELHDHAKDYMVARGVAGWRERVLIGQQSSGSSGAGQTAAGNEAVKQANNVLLRADWPTFCEGFWDLGADAFWGLLGAAGGANGGTGIFDSRFRQDFLHPTAYGHDDLTARIFAPALNTYLGGATLPASIIVQPTAVNVAAGAATRLTAIPLTAAKARLYGKTVTWASPDRSRVVVSARGLVTGLAATPGLTLSAQLGSAVGHASAVVTASAYVPSVWKTLIAELDGDAFVRAIWMPKFGGAAFAGGLISSIAELRGAAGIPAIAQANGALQPAYDNVLGIVSSDGTKEMSTGDSAAFDMELDHTNYSIVIATGAGGANGYLITTAPVALSRSEGFGKVGANIGGVGGADGGDTGIALGGATRLLVNRLSGATYTYEVASHGRVSDRKREVDWSGASAVSVFVAAPGAGAAFRAGGSFAGRVILNRASLPQEDAIMAAFAAANFGAAIAA